MKSAYLSLSDANLDGTNPRRQLFARRAGPLVIVHGVKDWYGRAGLWWSCNRVSALRASSRPRYPDRVQSSKCRPTSLFHRRRAGAISLFHPRLCSGLSGSALRRCRTRCRPTSDSTAYSLRARLSFPTVSLVRQAQ